MIKNHNFSPQLNKKSFNQTQILFNQSQILQIQQLDLNFMNGSKSKLINKKNPSSVTKIKPSTDRTYKNDIPKKSLGNTIDLIKNTTLQCNHFDSNNNKTDRETLLQKKKSYAQSIRQKNKQILQQQTSSKSGTKFSNFQSINLNTSSKDIFTPPKDIKNKENRSTIYFGVQTQYYSSSKNFQSQSNVFKQTNTNIQNQNMNKSVSSNDVIGFKNLKINNVSSKIKNIMNNTIDLNNCYEISGRGNGSTGKKSNGIKDKQNSMVIPMNPPPLSGKKPNSAIKSGSYAQIFDKKSTINALLNHQKNQTSNSLTGSIRRLNSISNKKQSLKSMNASQQNFQFGGHQISKNVDFENYQIQNPNGYVVDQFSQTIQQISQIQQSPQIQKEQNNVQNSFKKQQLSQKFTLNSRLYSQTIDFTEIYRKQRQQQQKQIIVLAKQNGTFKKELATFRKQNSTIKKQLQNCKKYIKELEQKSQKLLQQQQISKSAFKYSSNLSFTPSRQFSQQNDLFSSTCSSFIYQPKSLNSNIVNGNLEDILQNSQQQLFSLKSQNKALQLKVYMLEKKLIHQQQLGKKRIALQVNNWKQKYNKLRNQHLRTKNSFLNNPFMNSDWSISMDISRDE